MFSDELPKQDSPTTDRDYHAPKIPVPMAVCLSIVTVPVLAGLVISTAALTLLKRGGEVSEETLRGDRLPILNLPLQ